MRSFSSPDRRTVIRSAPSTDFRCASAHQYSFYWDVFIAQHMQPSSEDMTDTEWRQLRLSLERPYKDDLGKPIPVLFDITPDGERIYES